MFFSSPSTRKMTKYAPNYVPINMNGLAQISQKIIKDDDVPIFPVILSTPDSLRSSLKHYYDCTGILLSTFCVEFNTICI